MAGDRDSRVFETVAHAGREAMRRIWAARDERETLDPPARRVLEILEQHREFRECWEGGEPREGENPFLHVSLHQVIEEQLESDDPPEARAALERLQESGIERHAAVHELLRVLVLALYEMARTRGEFDQSAYRRALKTLEAPASEKDS
jgi:hypothetical protein